MLYDQHQEADDDQSQIGCHFGARGTSGAGLLIFDFLCRFVACIIRYYYFVMISILVCLLLDWQ